MPAEPVVVSGMMSLPMILGDWPGGVKLDRMPKPAFWPVKSEYSIWSAHEPGGRARFHETTAWRTVDGNGPI